MNQPEQHLLAGRHIWDGGCVSYCTCGHAYYGSDRQAADIAWQQHADAMDARRPPP